MIRKVVYPVLPLLLFVFLIPILSTASLAEGSGQFTVLSAYWSSQQSPSCVGAGMQMQQFVVTIRYNGNSSYGGVKGLLYLPSYFSDSISGGSIASAVSMSPIAQGQTATLKFWVDVSSDAQPGDYQASLAIYVYDEGTWKDIEMDPLTITLSSTPSISINLPSAIAVVPGYFNLTVPVENSGSGYAYGAALSASSQQQVAILQQTLNIGDIEPGSNYYAQLPLYIPPSAVGSLIPLTLKLSYVDSCGYSDSFSDTVYLNVQQPTSPQLSVQLSTSTLTAGVNSTISVTVSNPGNQTAKGVTASLEPSQQLITTGEVASVSLGDLLPGYSATATFNVLPLGISSSKSVLQLYLDLSYTDSYGIARTLRIPLMITVVQPKSLLAVSVQPQSLSAGRLSTVTISVKNIGNTTISGADAIISLPQLMNFIGFDGRWYIGDLQPGEERDLQIPVFISQAASGVLGITVSITYTDSSFIQRTDTRTEGILVLGSPVATYFTISPSPQSIVGGYCCSQVNLTVTNTAPKELDNVTVAMQLSGGLVLAGSSGRFYLGSMGPGESKTFSLSVYASPTQSVQYISSVATITYLDPLSGSVGTESDQFTLMVLPASSKLPLLVNSTEWILTAGQTNYLNISIINPNNFSVGAVSISFTAPSGMIIPGTGTYYFDSLGPGGSAQITIPLYIPSTTSSTATTLTASLSYFDGYSIVSATKTLSFLLALLPSIKVTNYAVLPQTISPGQTFSTSLTLANTGVGPAYNITVSVLPSTLYTALLGTQSFVNQLNSGSSTTLTFSFRLSSEANATYAYNATTTRTFTRTFTGTEIPGYGNITRTFPFGAGGVPREGVGFLITYSDNVGRQYSLEFSVPLAISSGSNSTTTTIVSASTRSPSSYALPIAVAAVVVLLLYAVLRIAMRGKK